jgi:nucleotide-binding universal stress UspA family protein
MKPIIAAIDFSNSSPLVLRHALRAADMGGADLIAMHVLDESRIDFIMSLSEKGGDPVILGDQAKEKFNRLVAAEAPGRSITFRVEIGKPAETMARVLEEVSAGLLIIGANDMTKKRLGSVAARCVRTSPCDVLVLRDWQGGNFRKIVVCNDFSKPASRAIASGAAIAASHGASLQIVNVIYPPDMDSWGATLEHRLDSPTSYSEECHARAQWMMDKSLAPHLEALGGIPWEAMVIEGASSAAAITSHVTIVDADLVVMGTRGHSKLASYFIGTNAERLLQDLPVSVLAVR